MSSQVTLDVSIFISKIYSGLISEGEPAIIAVDSSTVLSIISFAAYNLSPVATMPCD
jgi:hypothetical protein